MSDEVIIKYDRDDSSTEDGIEVPLDRINPDTLRNMAEEFVTREWSELGDAGFTLETKVNQVIQQLKEGRAKVVFDQTSETCNIVPKEGKFHV